MLFALSSRRTGKGLGRLQKYVDARFDKVEKKLEALQDYVDVHFNMIDERFNELGLRRWSAVFEEKNMQED